MCLLFCCTDGIIGQRIAYKRSWELFNQMKGKIRVFLALLFLEGQIFWGACCERQQVETDDAGGTMTFVLGTDEGYIMPTMVTVYSLLKNGIQGNDRTKNISIIILSDRLTDLQQTEITEYIGRIAEVLDKEHYKENLSIKFLNTENKQLSKYAKKVNFDGINLHEKFINNKMVSGYVQTRKAVLPFYFASQCSDIKDNEIIPEMEYESEDGDYEEQRKNDQKVDESDDKGSPEFQVYHYMWLDSDILIVGSISELYSSCRAKSFVKIEDKKKGIKEGIICCSNLNFTNNGAYRIQERVPSIEYTNNENPDTNSSKWRCSGGVMFFNVATRNDVSQKWEPLFYARKLEQGVVHTPKDEEVFFENLVKGQKYCTGCIYAFSPIYDCKPDMPSNAKCKSGQCKDVQPLQELFNDNNIVVWHWDRKYKPWDWVQNKAKKSIDVNEKTIPAYEVWETTYNEMCKNVGGPSFSTYASAK